MHVVATAGHVDHGKSTLVRALTGRDPDRLEEEKRRGLSIRLGYCWTSMAGVGEVAFVDVPGHERFIATTLAGMGPVPVVMFVVAADDPWMPQAAEHLAALDTLGVTHGVLVVTRSDLADPAPALARARDELSRTSLAGVAAVCVSARTGAGVDELRLVLARVLGALPAPDARADVRLWVDRRFHVRGTGTVVTGTLPAGTITVGDRLALDDELVRVRGIECLERQVRTAGGPARVALDLGGKAPTAVEHDSVLVTPGAFEHARVVDVRLRGDHDRVPERPLLHVGAASLSVQVRVLGQGFARLTLDRPLPLRIGDRAILRDPGDRRLWGLVVLDVDPVPLRRRGAADARAQDLARLDGSLAAELTLRGVVRRTRLRRLGIATETLPEGTVATGDWLVSAARAAKLRRALLQEVQTASGQDPPGLSPERAARSLGLPDPAIVLALVTPPVRVDSGRLRTGDPGVPEHLGEALAALREDLVDAPFAAPDAARIASVGLDDRALVLFHREGQLLRLAEGIVLLPGADRRAADRLRCLEQPFTTSQARQALDTSRRVVLPLLAHLDRTGHTVRLPDDRRRMRVAEPS